MISGSAAYSVIMVAVHPLFRSSDLVYITIIVRLLNCLSGIPALSHPRGVDDRKGHIFVACMLCKAVFTKEGLIWIAIIEAAGADFICWFSADRAAYVRGMVLGDELDTVLVIGSKPDEIKDFEGEICAVAEVIDILTIQAHSKRAGRP